MMMMMMMMMMMILADKLSKFLQGWEVELKPHQEEEKDDSAGGGVSLPFCWSIVEKMES